MRSALGGMLADPAAFADGPPPPSSSNAYFCDGTPRPLHPAEKTYFAKFTVERDALPKAPPGWKAKITPKAARTTICMEDGAGNSDEGPAMDYVIEVGAQYARPMTAAEKAKDQDFTGKMVEIQYADSVSAKQKAELAKLKKQSEALKADRKASVRINAQLMMGGGDYIRPVCYGTPKKLTVAGAMAYECYNYDPGDPAITSQIVVLFGKFTPSSSKGWYLDADGKQVQSEELQFRPVFGGADHPSTYVEFLVVVIKADNGRGPKSFSRAWILRNSAS